MDNVSELMFYVIAADALVVLILGATASFLIATGKDAKAFFERIVPATAMLVITSFAAGVILWIGDYMFR